MNLRDCVWEIRYRIIIKTILQEKETRSKESSIMNIASVCPVTGISYDFSRLEDRNRAVSRLCSEKPYVLITSPLHPNSS